jgi:hypothetical protein
MNLYACREYEGFDATALEMEQSDCLQGATPGGWAEAHCSRTDALGGCRTTNGTMSVTLWSYPGGGSTVQNVMNTCAVAMGTYVSP